MNGFQLQLKYNIYICPDPIKHTATVDNKTVLVDLWETAGQEHSRVCMPPIATRHTPASRCSLCRGKPPTRPWAPAKQSFGRSGQRSHPSCCRYKGDPKHFSANTGIQLVQHKVNNLRTRLSNHPMNRLAPTGPGPQHTTTPALSLWPQVSRPSQGHTQCSGWPLSL